MKYLVLFAVLAIAYMVWRNGRLEGKGQAGQAKRAEPPPPQDMVQCAACSVHLPRGDAVAGTQGRLYCSHEHLAQAE